MMADSISPISMTGQNLYHLASGQVCCEGGRLLFPKKRRRGSNWSRWVSFCMGTSVLNVGRTKAWIALPLIKSSFIEWSV